MGAGVFHVHDKTICRAAPPPITAARRGGPGGWPPRASGPLVAHSTTLPQGGGPVWFCAHPAPRVDAYHGETVFGSRSGAEAGGAGARPPPRRQQRYQKHNRIGGIFMYIYIISGSATHEAPAPSSGQPYVRECKSTTYQNCVVAGTRRAASTSFDYWSSVPRGAGPRTMLAGPTPSGAPSRRPRPGGATPPTLTCRRRHSSGYRGASPSEAAGRRACRCLPWAAGPLTKH